MLYRLIAGTVLVILTIAPMAFAVVPWSLTESGNTNPLTNGNWIQSSSDGNGFGVFTVNQNGSTPTSDNIYMNLSVTGIQKTKVRQNPSSILNGTGSTVRLITRINSGGNSGNYGFEHRDSFGTMEIGYEKNVSDDHGMIRLINRGGAPTVEATVYFINQWHVFWFVHHPNGNVYVWIDPTSSDNNLGTADLIRVNGSDTSDQITWGTESAGQVTNQDFDDIRFATGVYLPFDDNTLPIITIPSTPTPTRTPTPTNTPTRTPTPNQPRIDLVSIRQLGRYENGNFNGDGLRAIYFHVVDDDGNRIPGVDCYYRVNGGATQNIGQTGFQDVTFPDFHQFGFPEFEQQDFVEVRISYQGTFSDWSPILYRDVPPYNMLYSWELFYVYSPDTVTRQNTYYFKPFERSYDNAHVKLNSGTGIVNSYPDYDYESDIRETIQVGSANLVYTQTFAARGNRVIAAKGFATTEFFDSNNNLAKVQYRATIHEGGPNGPQIGPSRTTPLYFSFEYPKVTVFWPFEGPDSVPVVAGQTYALRLTKLVASGVNGTYSAWVGIGDRYLGGALYRDGVLIPQNIDIVGAVITADAGLPNASPTPMPTSTATPTFGPSPTPFPTFTGVDENWQEYR